MARGVTSKLHLKKNKKTPLYWIWAAFRRNGLGNTQVLVFASGHARKQQKYVALVVLYTEFANRQTGARHPSGPVSQVRLAAVGWPEVNLATSKQAVLLPGHNVAHAALGALPYPQILAIGNLKAFCF